MSDNSFEFGYTQKWFDYGVLDRAFYERQVEAFNIDSEMTSEHYRYAAFVRWMRGRTSATELELVQFVNLALEDEDSRIAGSVIGLRPISHLIRNMSLATR